MKDRKIIFLHEVLESKIRKEKELEYYQQELDKLQHKMSFLRQEINLTNLIIEMIEQEKIVDIQQRLIDAYNKED